MATEREEKGMEEQAVQSPRNTSIPVNENTVDMDIGRAADQSGPSLQSVTISGPLSEDMRLRSPMMAHVLHDDGEVVVSEPQYHMHGYGDSLQAAIDDFRLVLMDSLQLLEEDEGSLSSQLRDQLDYLRSIISVSAQ